MASQTLRPRLASTWCNADPPLNTSTTTLLLECRFADSTVSQRISACITHSKLLARTEQLFLSISDTKCRYTSAYSAQRLTLSISCNVPHSDNQSVHFGEITFRLVNLAPLPSPVCPSPEMAKHLETQTLSSCQLRSQPSFLPISYRPPGTSATGNASVSVFEHLDVTLLRASPLVKEPPPLRDRLLQLSILLFPFSTLFPSQKPNYLPKEPLSPTEIETLRQPMPTTSRVYRRSPPPTISDPINQPATRPPSALEPDDPSDPILTLDPQSYAHHVYTQYDAAENPASPSRPVISIENTSPDEVPAISYTSHVLVRPLSPDRIRQPSEPNPPIYQDEFDPPPSYSTSQLLNQHTTPRTPITPRDSKL